MARYLGIDTSNYTTSLALFDTQTGKVTQQKRLLPVRKGELGLRQSDAVFHHVKQLPELMEQLCGDTSLMVDGIGVSCRPMEREGSYMPCFLVGEGLARSLAATWKLPLFSLTHQQGHVAAACFGAGNLSLLDAPLLAFHVSGGTTDGLLVKPHKNGGIICTQVAGSLDLKAGQLIDRVGGMLGLPFPAGAALDNLANESTVMFRCCPSVEGAYCHLSGIQNQCEARYKAGSPASEIARFCLFSIEAALCAMVDCLVAEYGNLPIVFAGGVMANSLLQARLKERYHAYFAPPVLSADNAAGIALLASRLAQREVSYG